MAQELCFPLCVATLWLQHKTLCTARREEHKRLRLCTSSTTRGLVLSVPIGFDGLDTVPSAFVLMGNFQSQPATTASTDYSAIREQFKTLASIISQYQRLQVTCQAFCFNARRHPPSLCTSYCRLQRREQRIACAVYVFIVLTVP